MRYVPVTNASDQDPFAGMQARELEVLGQVRGPLCRPLGGLGCESCASTGQPRRAMNQVALTPTSNAITVEIPISAHG